MSTYPKIQKYVKDKYGYTIETCHIAHVKELCGIKIKPVPNRIDKNVRTNPCPEDKVKYIKEALIYFGILKE